MNYRNIRVGWNGEDFVNNVITAIADLDKYKVPRILNRIYK